jgi:hypothetical protein
MPSRNSVMASLVQSKEMPLLKEVAFLIFIFPKYLPLNK